MKLEDLNERAKQYAIYFDYTGAGRGPEPVAGPFPSTSEAEEYAAEMEIDLDDGDHFIDVYRER